MFSSSPGNADQGCAPCGQSCGASAGAGHEGSCGQAAALGYACCRTPAPRLRGAATPRASGGEGARTRSEDLPMSPALSCALLTRTACAAPRVLLGVIVDNEDMATGMEKKEIEGTADIFWSREPIMGPRGTKENPAIVPSFNTSRVVGLETEQARAASIACGSRLGMRQHDVAPFEDARVCRRRRRRLRCGDLLRAHRLLGRVSSGSNSRRARCTSSPISTSSWSSWMVAITTKRSTYDMGVDRPQPSCAAGMRRGGDGNGGPRLRA